MIKTYLAVSATQPQIQTNAPPNQFDPWVLFYISVGGVGTFLASFIPKVMDSSILSKRIDAGINQKQAETNAVVAERLTDINIEKQKEENFIDQSTALADIAKAGVNNSAETTSYLLKLTESAISSSAANTQSTQSIARASESQVQATEDLIKATAHNSEALKSLTQAIEAIPKEIASINDIYAAEFRVALNHIDARLAEAIKLIKQTQSLMIEEYSNSFQDLRRTISTKDNH